MKKIILLLLGLLNLAACSLFSPVKSTTPNTYLINTVPQPTTKKLNHTLNLLVTQPEADPIYNTTAIAYTARPHEIGYLVKSTWAETPSQMLQTLMIQTLRKTNHFHTVGSLATITQNNFTLNTQLIKLQQNFSQFPYRVQVILRAQIINTNTNQIVASKELSAETLIAKKDTYMGIIATNQAVANILLQLAQFCLQNM